MSLPWLCLRRLGLPAAVLVAAAVSGSPAAGQVFSDLDNDHRWHIGRRLWVRTFPNETGWFVPLSEEGDYVLWHVDDDLAIDWTDGVYLTGRDDLTDHGIARCTDGGYLHVGARLESGTPAQFASRFGRDWSPGVVAEPIVEGDGVYASDPPVVCSPALDAAGHGAGEGSFLLSVLDDDLAVTDEMAIPAPAMAAGSSMLVEPTTDTLLVVYGVANSWDGGIHMRRYTRDMDLLEEKRLTVPLPSEDHAPYWPQGLLRVGDHYLLAYVVGTQDAVDMYGDIQLTAFDADFEEVQTIVAMAQGNLPWGFMRPWISCRDDRVLVSFDHNNDDVTFLVSVTIDLEALGVDTSGADPASYGDCAWPPWPDEVDDGGDDDDGGSPPITAGAGACACAVTGGDGRPAAGALAALLLLAWRRRTVRSAHRAAGTRHRTRGPGR